MEYYDDEFYYEPSEFDVQIDEFKASLTKSVKEKFVAEMERLKKENEELQVVKTNFEKIKIEYKEKERQLEYERKNLEGKVKRDRLSSLTKDFEIVMYRANSKREVPPKCDKCDDNRNIHYKTPRGKDTYENCDCSEGQYVYHPQEYICCEFKINQDKNGMSVWYKISPIDRHRDDDCASLDNSTFAKVIYHEGLEFEGLTPYETFFKAEEECQAYYDYLNAKKREE